SPRPGWLEQVAYAAAERRCQVLECVHGWVPTAVLDLGNRGLAQPAGGVRELFLRPVPQFPQTPHVVGQRLAVRTLRFLRALHRARSAITAAAVLYALAYM